MAAEAGYAPTRDRNVPWFQPELEKLDPDARKVLETYSNVPSDKVLSHVLSIRDKAWEVFPYPCIGQFRFLNMAIGSFKLYPEILERLKSGEEKYLDLGCCFGQDIRRLVYDGAPAEALVGSDLHTGFLDLGYDLFLDKDSLSSKFIAADVFDPESKLEDLYGCVDIIHSSSFFHLFGYEGQKSVARRVVQLLKPQKGSLLVGRQIANVTAQEVESKGTSGNGTMFQHNTDSWKQMWKEIGQETGTSWDVDAELVEWPGITDQKVDWHMAGAKRLMFSVKRL